MKKTNDIEVIAEELKTMGFSKSIRAAEKGDRMVFVGDNSTVKGTFMEKVEKNGREFFKIKPDGFKEGDRMFGVELTEKNAQRLDGLFSVGKDGKKRDRQFGYVEFENLISNDQFYGLGYDNLQTEEMNKLRNTLLSGNRSEVIKDLTFSNYDKNTNLETKDVRDAVFELYRDRNGNARVFANKSEQELSLEKASVGKYEATFTHEQQMKLAKDKELGLATFKHSETGKERKFYVGVHEGLNKLVTRPEWAIRTDNIYGTKTDKEQQKRLKEGKTVQITTGKGDMYYRVSAATPARNGIYDYDEKQAQQLGLIKTPEHENDKGKDKKADKTAKLSH